MSEVHEFDVVVVGCGIAGLSASLASQEQGVRVAMLERAPYEERGGNTRFTEAFLRMDNIDQVAHDFEAHFLENAGGHLDPSLVAETTRDYKSWPSVVKCLNFFDPEVLYSFAENAGPTLNWLTSHGMRFDYTTTPFLTTCTSRMAPVGGGLALVETLSERAVKLGVEIFYETTAYDLIMDDSAKVTGLKAVGKNNQAMEFRAPSVILASGGFEGNSEMLAKYLGPQSLHIRPVARGGYYNRGEGIRMALDAGAAPCGDFSSYHAEPIDPRSGVPEAAIFVFPYGILVNQEGHRFTDEAIGTVDATYEPVTRQIYFQTDGLAYVILDAKIDDVPNWQRAVRSDQPAIEANSLPELAEKLDIPVVVFERTVIEYNAACPVRGEYKPFELDGLATSDELLPPKSNWARPIDEGPYKAFPIISANVFTFGGLKVDPNARVLNCDGEVIPGLYAAGETVGSYYKTYTGSTSVLKGAVFGRLAGQDCVRYLMAE